MPLQYADDITEEHLYTVDANWQHLYLSHIINIFIIAVVTGLCLILLGSLDALDIFTTILELVGLDSWLAITKFTTGVLAAGVVGFGLYDYAVAGDVRYEVHTDKLVLHTHDYVVALTERELPYENVSAVTYDQDGIADELLDTGSITVKLTGRADEQVQLYAVDNVEQVTEYIQEVMETHAAERQDAATTNKRIQESFDKALE